MDFQHSEDQLALRDLARQILTDKLTNDRLKELANDREFFDRETWGELARANLLGASLPESVGGSGLGFTEVALLLQEIGRTFARDHTSVMYAIDVVERRIVERPQLRYEVEALATRMSSAPPPRSRTPYSGGRSSRRTRRT